MCWWMKEEGAVDPWLGFIFIQRRKRWQQRVGESERAWLQFGTALWTEKWVAYGQWKWKIGRWVFSLVFSSSSSLVLFASATMCTMTGFCACFLFFFWPFRVSYSPYYCFWMPCVPWCPWFVCLTWISSFKQPTRLTLTRRLWRLVASPTTTLTLLLSLLPSSVSVLTVSSCFVSCFLVLRFFSCLFFFFFVLPACWDWQGLSSGLVPSVGCDCGHEVVFWVVFVFSIILVRVSLDFGCGSCQLQAKVLYPSGRKKTTPAPPSQPQLEFCRVF